MGREAAERLSGLAGVASGAGSGARLSHAKTVLYIFLIGSSLYENSYRTLTPRLFAGLTGHLIVNRILKPISGAYHFFFDTIKYIDVNLLLIYY